MDAVKKTDIYIISTLNNVRHLRSALALRSGYTYDNLRGITGREGAVTFTGFRRITALQFAFLEFSTSTADTREHFKNASRL